MKSADPTDVPGSSVSDSEALSDGSVAVSEVVSSVADSEVGSVVSVSEADVSEAGVVTSLSFSFLAQEESAKTNTVIRTAMVNARDVFPDVDVCFFM